MKSFTIAASAILMATLASGRVINKARAAPDSTATAAGAPVTASPAVEAPTQPNRQAFELDVTTANLGLSDYYSRDDGFIVVQIGPADVLEQATVRSVGDNVVCTISDAQGFQIRQIGGELSDTYEREEWDPKAASVGCYFV